MNFRFLLSATGLLFASGWIQADSYSFPRQQPAQTSYVTNAPTENPSVGQGQWVILYSAAVVSPANTRETANRPSGNGPIVLTQAQELAPAPTKPLPMPNSVQADGEVPALAAPPTAVNPPPPRSFDPASPATGRFLAGGGFYFIRPFFDKNPAFSTTFASNTATLTNQTNFSWDYEFVPRVWLGYVADNGLGIRSQFWHFDQSASASLVNADQTGDLTISSAAPLGLSITSPGFIVKQGVDRLLYEHRLKLDVVDLEASQDFQFGRWSLLVTSGARYAHLAQNYNAFRSDPPSGQGVLPGCSPSGVQPKKCMAINPPPPGGMDGQAGTPVVIIDDVDVLTSGHNFSGVGPTISLGLQRALGESGFALFGNFRGSILFGRSSQRADLSGFLIGEFIVPPGPNVPFSAVTFESHEDHWSPVLPVVELELGTAWGRNWRNLYVFAEAALVAQTWFNAGNASTEQGDLGFFGMTLMAGIGY